MAADRGRKLDLVNMELRVTTRGHFDFVDVTDQVNGHLKEVGAVDGAVLVFVKGTTASVMVNENEPGFREDLVKHWQALAPITGDYQHNRNANDGNAYAHILATLVGSSLTLPIKDGMLNLGVWQRVLIVDFDERPRERQLVIQVL